jgi:hypothetical protein
MISNLSRTTSYLKSIPMSVKNSTAPLSLLDVDKVEGLQKGIKLFDGINLKDIAFITKKLETLNFFRGCSVGCTHCLKDAKCKNGIKSVLFEDIKRFTQGFKELSERFGFNILNGIKYLSIIDDANPSDVLIKGLERNHTVAEGIKLISDNLGISSLYVTSGWNKNSIIAQSGAEEIAQMIVKNPSSAKVEISINPFSKIMEISRKALKNNNKEKADYYRKMFIERMANTIATFSELFKLNKAEIIYRHAQDFKGNELVNASSTAKLYNDIYNEVSKILGSSIESIPDLSPEFVTREKVSHFIEPSGRARAYFPYDINLKVQQGLISESLIWGDLSKEEKYDFLRDNSLKCVDINGRIYTTRPANNTYCINSPIELITPTEIKLNYINNQKTDNIFSDIELES